MRSMSATLSDCAALSSFRSDRTSWAPLETASSSSRHLRRNRSLCWQTTATMVCSPSSSLPPNGIPLLPRDILPGSSPGRCRFSELRAATLSSSCSTSLDFSSRAASRSAVWDREASSSLRASASSSLQRVSWCSRWRFFSSIMASSDPGGPRFFIGSCVCASSSTSTETWLKPTAWRALTCCLRVSSWSALGLHESSCSRAALCASCASRASRILATRAPLLARSSASWHSRASTSACRYELRSRWAESSSRRDCSLRCCS
mmetsp:Transcript_15640/g.37157  ORF Transcript_15640/g.37157 Transcript_15640/m.37157 type:complete len:262 (+) Transcript_15640:43-828(+)